MNKFHKGIMVILMILTFYECNIYSQSRSELEKKKKRANKEIEEATKLLKNISKDKEASSEKLFIINRKINLRKTLIISIENEINEVNKKIEHNQNIIVSLEDELVKLKEEYAKMIYYAYKNFKTQDRVLYILAAKDFNQAYKRTKYLQQYSEYRKKQANLIITVQEVIKGNLVELEKYKAKKLALLNEHKTENRSLEYEISSQKKLIKNLTKKEKELKKEIDEKRKVTKNVEREIRRIIEKESKKSMNAASKLTPEEKVISNEFKNNRGKLPWPTERGVVTEKFGEHQHPVLKDITIRNNGVDISTVPNSEVSAVFGGTVTKVIAILGANYTVIIKHGEYYTVYQNLVDITVKQGQNIRLKQKIGKVFTDSNSNKTILHIEIWKNLEKLDPELWLSY